jgi:hypothetical protein
VRLLACFVPVVLILSFARVQDAAAAGDSSAQPQSERRGVAIAPPAADGGAQETRELGATAYVSARVRDFVRFRKDLERSALLAFVVVPLLLLLLLERELLTAAARSGGRGFAVHALVLFACFAVLAFVRLRAYLA